MNDGTTFPGPRRPNPSGDQGAPNPAFTTAYSNMASKDYQVSDSAATPQPEIPVNPGQMPGESPYTSSRSDESEAHTGSPYTTFKAEPQPSTPFQESMPLPEGRALAVPTAPSPRVPRMPRRAPREQSVGGNSSRRVVMYGLLAIFGILFFVLSNMNSGSIGGIGEDRTYSYYEDRTYDDTGIGSRWDNTDVFGSDSKWEYDGTYRYGKYGSAQIKDAKKGGVDPTLGSTVIEDPDVFAQYLRGGASVADRFDPTGGQPVGLTPDYLNYGAVDYNPYASYYSNPYMNRLDLRFGAGYGQGATPRPGGSAAKARNQQRAAKK